MSSYTDEEKQYAKVIVKSWKDSSFRSQLLANPRATLEAEGVHIPKNVQVTIADGTTNTLALGLPPKPAGIGDDELQGHAEAFFCCSTF
jgi:hypothetical protein